MPPCPRLLPLGTLCSRAGCVFMWCPFAMALSLVMPVRNEAGPRRAVRLIVSGTSPCYLLSRIIVASSTLTRSRAIFGYCRLLPVARGPARNDSALLSASPPVALPPKTFLPSHRNTAALDQRRLAGTQEHLMPPVPNNPWCPVCQRATARRQQCQDRVAMLFCWANRLGGAPLATA